MRNRINVNLISSKKSFFTWIKWIVGLIVSTSFITNNLDVIGVKVDNPIPWLSVSNLVNKLRDPLKKEVEISEENILKNNYHILVEFKDDISKKEKDKTISFMLNQLFINKKIPLKQYVLENKKCPLIIDNTFNKLGLKYFSCELKIIVVKDVVYKNKDKFYKKDIRLDNVFLKQLSPIIKNAEKNDQLASWIFDKYNKDSINLHIKNNTLTQEEKENLIIKKNWDIYQKYYKKTNVIFNLSNEIKITKCPTTMENILSIQASFDCRLINFNIKNAPFIENGSVKKFSTSVSDIVLYNFKLNL